MVFPEAEIKFYLDASAEERAKRRALQLREQGLVADIPRLIQDIQKRDYDDAHREAAPLRQAEDAIYIDSTALAPDEVVETMMAEIRKISGND